MAKSSVWLIPLGESFQVVLVEGLNQLSFRSSRSRVLKQKSQVWAVYCTFPGPCFESSIFQVQELSE